MSFARAMLGAGFDAAITAARGGAALGEAVTTLRTEFGADRVIGIQADVGSSEDAERTINAVLGQFGRLDCLVSNAGRGPRELREDFHIHPPKFWEIAPEDWVELVRTNLNGPFLMARAAVPHMIGAGWGRIIHISTSRMTMVKQGNAPYGPTKAALDAMTRQFADDLQGTGVTVNVLAPGGPTDTAFFAEGDRSGVYAQLLPASVMDEALIWLCSEAADDVTAGRFIGKLWNPEDPGAAREDTGQPPRIL